MTDLDDSIPEACPHCDQVQPRSKVDDHIVTAHTDLPPCTATITNEGTQNIEHCAFRAGHAAGRGEFGEWHANRRGPLGRHVWNDTARGAVPHSPRPEEKAVPRPRPAQGATVAEYADIVFTRHQGQAITVDGPAPARTRIHLQALMDRYAYLHMPTPDTVVFADQVVYRITGYADGALELELVEDWRPKAKEQTDA